MVGEAVLPIAILICGGEGVVARLVVASVVVARVVVARVMVVRMVVVRVSTACFRSALCVESTRGRMRGATPTPVDVLAPVLGTS